MRVCPNCGKEQPDGTAFCGECGAKLEETEPVEKAASSEETSNEATETDEAKSGSGEESVGTSTDTSDVAEQVSAESDSASEAAKVSDASEEVSQSAESKVGEIKSKGLSRNRLIGIIIAIVVVIVVVIIVLVVALGGNGVSAQTVEDDFKETPYYKEGIVPSNYVNESDYELVDFSIDRQEDVSGTAHNERDVYFSGTMENANFRTKLSGHARYTKDNNGSWDLINSSFQIDEGSKSEPIEGKGVDSFEKDPKDETCEDFQSTFSNEGDSKYTSTATGTVTYEYWYATDTATKEQTFSFSSDDGWVSDGDSELKNASTSWAALDEKTFELEENSGTDLMGQTFPTSSLTFIVNSEDEENVITAHYKILYDPPESASSIDSIGTGNIYTPINLEGDAISTNVKHSVGEDAFSFELQDTEGKSVTFDCEKGTDKTIQGDIKKHTMKVSFTTGEVYYTWRATQTNHEDTYTLDLKDTTYVEDVSS